LLDLSRMFVVVMHAWRVHMDMAMVVARIVMPQNRLVRLTSAATKSEHRTKHR
jgi:hypothetical protein